MHMPNDVRDRLILFASDALKPSTYQALTHKRVNQRKRFAIRHHGGSFCPQKQLCCIYLHHVRLPVFLNCDDQHIVHDGRMNRVQD